MSFSIGVEPRDYQIEAVEWAVERQRAVCCMPTGTGKTLVGLLWVKELVERGLARRILLLEPTRLLVNQIAQYYSDKGGVECEPVDGRLPPQVREGRWQSPLVVATPHAAYNDRHWVHFDAVVVDECHHTVGQDAFAKLMDELDFPYRLGLSATVPTARVPEVVSRIGEIRRWSWEDPSIRPHMPAWVGELYEADLCPEELAVLEHIRNSSGGGLSGTLLERYLARDGSAALAETLAGANRFGRMYGPVLLPLLPSPRDRLHKMASLREIFAGHEFTKAIVFVDRKVIAHAVAAAFPELNPVLLLGGSDKRWQGQALRAARDTKCRLVVATRVGEEGIDLPEADLAVSWGSVASEIRFVQRHGRIMRRSGASLAKAPGRLKFAAFIVTPDTVDLDSFVAGLERAQSSGHLKVEETFGWEPSILWPKTTWWHLTESLRGKPQPLAALGQFFGLPETKTEALLSGVLRKGRVFYFYDVQRIARDFVAERVRQAATPGEEASGVACAGVQREPDTVTKLSAASHKYGDVL